jgi:hypothetical protein
MVRCPVKVLVVRVSPAAGVARTVIAKPATNVSLLVIDFVMAFTLKEKIISDLPSKALLTSFLP